MTRAPSTPAATEAQGLIETYHVPSVTKGNLVQTHFHSISLKPGSNVNSYNRWK